jgi:hypothetical protein
MLMCDLDGVLADFHGAACRVHDRPSYAPDCWDFFIDWGMTLEQFWQPIHALGERFYAGMVKPLPWAHEVWEAVTNADYDVSIVTCASSHHGAYGGKREWVTKHLGKDVPVMICSRKYLMAGEDRLLVDDSDSQCGQFALHGGKTILFPRSWNNNRRIEGHKMDYLTSALSVWKARQPHHQMQYAD